MQIQSTIDIIIPKEYLKDQHWQREVFSFRPRRFKHISPFSINNSILKLRCFAFLKYIIHISTLEQVWFDLTKIIRLWSVYSSTGH